MKAQFFTKDPYYRLWPESPQAGLSKATTNVNTNAAQVMKESVSDLSLKSTPELLITCDQGKIYNHLLRLTDRHGPGAW